MLKKIVFAFVFIVIGALIGGVGVMAAMGHHMSRGMLMLQEWDLIKIQDAAEDAYKNQPPEVGIWALNFYLDFFDGIIEQRIDAVGDEDYKDEDVFLFSYPGDKWLSYVQLAVLYDRLGDTENRDEAIQKAKEIRFFKAENADEEMMKLIDKMSRELDENRTP